MEGLTIDVFLSTLIPLLLYLIVTLAGALLKDRLNSITKKDMTFRLSRIIIGAVCGAFIMLTIEPFLLTKMSIQSVLGIAFMVGSFSFELFSYLSKFDNIKRIFKKYSKIKKILASPDEEDDDDGG